uniref:NADH:ubiquinone reductase (H(+)-translocating) n=1 Tax=Dugesia ryukyuensis TaxID=79738 RepID=G9M8W4_DUGRY|nr:NADH dehydrogenase subunit 5 [Dugesia ryukyuensis]
MFWLISYFLLSLLFFSLTTFLGSSSVCLFFDLISFNSLNFLNYILYFDFYSCLFFMILFSIVFCVYTFISYYFFLEVNLFRFIYLLNTFILSMVLLIVSPNLVSLLVGWDGLGFISFLLVCWFGSSASFSSSLKTFLVNRFGDALFILGLVFIFSYGSFNYFSSFFFVLVLALMTNSALYPFNSWLPEAMAAPTPVSALVHSSTLVVSGLYVLFRYFDFLTVNVLFFFTCIGLFTLYYGSFQALLAYDSKKLVAYSTLSQLGLLAFLLGLGLLDLFYFYLLVHAVFKASLFVSVGTYMVVGSHHQDMRYLSSVWFMNPVSLVVFIFSLLSLSGLPFFSCFFFKELVLSNIVNLNFGLFYIIFFLSSLLFTVLYSFRFLFVFVFNSSFYINSFLNYSYALLSSNIFSFFMLFYGLFFSYGLCLWYNVGSSVLLFVCIFFFYFFMLLLVSSAF